jgi:hypothetical protein
MVVGCPPAASIGAVRNRSPDVGLLIPPLGAGPLTFPMTREQNRAQEKNELVHFRWAWANRFWCFQVNNRRSLVNLEILIYCRTGRLTYLAALQTVATLSASGATGAARVHRNAEC